MIRCRYFLVAALLSSTSAFAAGNVTLTDQNGQYLGTPTNPLVTNGGFGGGAVYGTDATGAAPSKPPVFLAGIDGSGNIKPLQMTAVGTALTGAVLGFQGVGAGGIPLRVMANSGDVIMSCQYLTSFVTVSNTQALAIQCDKHLHSLTVEAGSDDPQAGINPVVVQSGTSALGKNGPSNLYSAYAVNNTTTAGYLVLINAAAAPASGTAITPIDVAALGGAVGATATVNYGAGPPNGYSTGIVALITTSLTTYTPGGNAFIQVRWR